MITDLFVCMNVMSTGRVRICYANHVVYCSLLVLVAIQSRFDISPGK